MPTPPLRPASERFAELLRALGWAVAKQTGWGLPLHLIAVIASRLQRIKHRFAALAARIAAGTYKPRQPAAAPRRKPESPPQPPPPNPLPNQPGWLLPLEKSAACQRGHLEALFQDAEMVALMAAAPEAMARLLRPLCRMLALDLPPVLAKRRAKPAAALGVAPPDLPAVGPAAEAEATPPRPPRSPPPPPAPPRMVPAPPSLTLAYACGPPQLVWN